MTKRWLWILAVGVFVACSDSTEASESDSVAPTTLQLQRSTSEMSARILGRAQNDDDADVRIALRETKGVAAHPASLVCGARTESSGIGVPGISRPIADRTGSKAAVSSSSFPRLLPELGASGEARGRSSGCHRIPALRGRGPVPPRLARRVTREPRWVKTSSVAPSSTGETFLNN